MWLLQTFLFNLQKCLTETNKGLVKSTKTSNASNHLIKENFVESKKLFSEFRKEIQTKINLKELKSWSTSDVTGILKELLFLYFNQGDFG